MLRRLGALVGGLFRNGLDMRNAEEILVVGRMPAGWTLQDLRSHFDVVVDPLTRSSRLSEQLRADKPRAMVVFIGDAEEEAGICLPDHTEEKPAYLPTTFWKVKVDVHLFAYACASAEYIKRPECANLIATGVGYSGRLWYSVQNERFWCGLLRKVCAAMREMGAADQRLLGAVQELYGKALKRRSREDWLTQLCLVQQTQALRLIKSGDI